MKESGRELSARSPERAAGFTDGLDGAPTRPRSEKQQHLSLSGSHGGGVTGLWCSAGSPSDSPVIYNTALVQSPRIHRKMLKCTPSLNKTEKGGRGGRGCEEQASVSGRAVRTSPWVWGRAADGCRRVGVWERAQGAGLPQRNRRAVGSCPEGRWSRRACPSCWAVRVVSRHVW